MSTDKSDISRDEEFRQLQKNILKFQREIKKIDLLFSKVSIMDAAEVLRDIQNDYVNRLKEISEQLDKLHDMYDEALDEALEYNQYYKEKKQSLMNKASN
jgi:predicted  nucleic acid-binding Zn-ribbon protein